MEVYLIRHALSQDAERGVSQRDGAPIVKDGVKENRYKNIKFDKVYCSPLLRARQTAEKLFDDFEVVDYIYEYKRPSLLDGVPRKEARKFWDKYWEEATTDPDWSYDGSESFNDIVKRVDRFYRFLKGLKFERVVVVGHSIFFRHLLSIHALGKKNYTIGVYYKLSVFINPLPLHYLKMEL